MHHCPIILCVFIQLIQFVILIKSQKYKDWNFKGMSLFTQAVSIVERDKNDETICVWSYPGVSNLIQTILEKRCSIECQKNQYVYIKVKTEWVYIFTLPSKSSDISTVSLCIISRSFNPEKFCKLSQILIDQYMTTSDPTKVLEGFLSICTTSKFNNKVGTINMTSYNDTDAYSVVSKLKELSLMLEDEIVVLWNAVLLKKRILVIGSSASGDCSKVLDIVRTLPQLAWHRQNWDICRPLVRSEPEHLDDLINSGIFIGGTLDSTMASRSDLYDVILSLEDRRVTITNHAIPGMKMCSIHKDLASIISTACNVDGATDLDIVRAIANKTQSILSNLKGLAGNTQDKITADLVTSNVSNVNTQYWLLKLIDAEGY